MAIGVGLLGAGLIGRIHAQAYSSIDEAGVVAVGDANRETADRLAGNHGARAYYDIESLVSDNEVEIVDVCVPTFLHERAVVAAARQGKHVLCEKPIALSLESIDRMLLMVQESGVMAMVAQVIRFWPEYVAIRETLERGELGKPLIATAARLQQPPDWGGWHRDPNLSGGALFDMHIHDLDYVYWLFGKPRSVYAVGVKSVTECWDHVVTSLQYGDKKAVVEASYLMPKDSPFVVGFRLLGTDGCMEYRFRVGGGINEREAAERDLTLHRPGKPAKHLPYSDEDAYVAEIEYFIGCVRQAKGPEIATLEGARNVLQITLAAKESLETGRVVDL